MFPYRIDHYLMIRAPFISNSKDHTAYNKKESGFRVFDWAIPLCRLTASVSIVGHICELIV